MKYQELSMSQFFRKVCSERKARDLAWSIKFGNQGFHCPKCSCEQFWEHKKRAEIRQCTQCQFQVRLRVGTLFEHSKVSMLNWMRAIFLVMQDKRGVSALQAQRLLGMPSYGTVWSMLMKIRKGLLERDSQYQIKDIIELDGAYFGKRKTENQASVFVAVERKDWIDQKGRKKSKAGFAKVMQDKHLMESREGAEKFVSKNVKHKSILHTDGKRSYQNLKNVKIVKHENTGNELPWVHRFISNAKRWVLGTHHGGKKNFKYIDYYLAEYTYRFNRRHDPNSLFHRALSACINTTPVRLHALCG